MKHIIYIFLVITFLGCSILSSSDQATSENKFDDRGYFRIMFYNTENLFDTYDDTLKNDEQFLPKGDKHWTYTKYLEKLKNIYKVIIGVGGWEPPEVVGLCELENRLVLEELLSKTPLQNIDYEIIHFESPDRRGIDVGMLYRKSKFQVIEKKPIPVVFPFDANKPTRDILYVKGITSKNDTLHLFVNHWPSRWGGQMETDGKRQYAASVVRKNVDSILNTNPKANIVIMGDFNDHANNKSLTDVLRANRKYDNISNNELYNLTYHLEESEGLGTHKYQGEWGVLDHLIVSGNILNHTTNPFSSLSGVHIYNKEFLLEKDNGAVGYKPFRTYVGFKFHGGFSDHLPVYLDLYRH